MVAGHNQVMQPLMTVWWKDRGSLHCESQLIISHVPQVKKSGESGKSGNSELIKGLGATEILALQTVSVHLKLGRNVVNFINSEQEDRQPYRSALVRSKLTWNQAWLLAHAAN